MGMFCPKCGSILIPKKDNNRKVMSCPSCSYKDTKAGESKLGGKVRDRQRDIEVVDRRDELETLPKTDAECPKCGNGKAYFWMLQTRASDEQTTLRRIPPGNTSLQNRFPKTI